MRKKLIYGFGATVMIFILFCGPTSASGNKTTALKKKMAEISSLRKNLSGKIDQATEKRELLKQKIEELKKEIKQAQEQRQIESYQEAVRNPRIDYNLKLIQLLLGYITGLSEKIVYFQNGHEMLDFYFQQAEDDLLMIKTLNDLEIDKLIAKINSVLDEFIPETDKPIFDAAGIPLKDTEKIWSEIVKYGSISVKIP